MGPAGVSIPSSRTQNTSPPAGTGPLSVCSRTGSTAPGWTCGAPAACSSRLPGRARLPRVLRRIVQCGFLPGPSLAVQISQSAGTLVVCNVTENGFFVRHLSLLAGHGEQNTASYCFPPSTPGPGPVRSSLKQLITQFRNRIDLCLLLPTGPTLGGV